jgi:hypothetical protein
VSRRPAARRPPKLDAADARTATKLGPRAEPTVRQRLVAARVTGRQRIGRPELLANMRGVLRADPNALLDVAPFTSLTIDDVVAATEDHWGVTDEGAIVAIDPDRTLARAVAGFGRVADVARRGGRIALATTRPASLLPLYQSLARAARAAGAVILEGDETGAERLDGRSGRRLWWLDGVAAMTDGAALLAGPGLGGAAELLFHLPPPDLLVADRALAGGAVSEGVEIVAPAGLDALVLGVAASRGAPLTVVPLADTCPAAAYRPLERLLAEVFAGAS